MGMINSGLIAMLITSETGKLTIAEIAKKGALNTILGMGTVFVVLIFISALISCFRVIPYLQAKLAKKNSINQEDNILPSEQKIEEGNNEELTNDLVEDLELVAVITAAIMESMGDEAPADGLVVRSIRKVNTKKWQNA